MSLTISSGPLSGHPPQTVNYEIDGPAHKLLMHEFPRRVRATFAGEAVSQTRSAACWYTRPACCRSCTCRAPTSAPT